MKQTITRKGSFDAGHRVMHERVKCFNIHGHLYQYELTFEYETMKDIGYAIDFKEIKRIACQYIDDYYDHGFILNPMDTVMFEACVDTKSKFRTMVFGMTIGAEDIFCNPTAENIAKDLFLSIKYLMAQFHELKLTNVRLYETPNCFVDCTTDSISVAEELNFTRAYHHQILDYVKEKGIIEYDDRL